MNGFDQYATVLSRFAGLKEAKWGYSAKCPAHEDNRQSLTIRFGDNGNLWLRCHAGCKFEDIAGAAGVEVRDCCKGGNGMANGKREVKAYDYRNETGMLLYQSVRFEPKGFAIRCPAEGGGDWIWHLGNTRRVLYRLPELIKHDKRRFVFVVEGEKDADRLAEISITATTNAMGAGKWRDEYSDSLAGFKVVIIPDNDKVGLEHSDAVAKSLAGKAASVKVLLLPGLPEHGDVSDWLDAGGTKEKLAELVTGKPAKTKEEPKPDEPPKLSKVKVLLDQLKATAAELEAELIQEPK